MVKKVSVTLRNRTNGKTCAVNVAASAVADIDIPSRPYDVADYLEAGEFRKLWKHLDLNTSWRNTKCLEVVGVSKD